MCTTAALPARVGWLSRVRLSWRRIKRNLQTSPRTRAHMIASTNERKMAMMERDRVHWANDTFMKEGKNGHDSVDERTLEKGLTWSFMLPFCLFFWVILVVVMYYSRRGRDGNQNELRVALEAALEERKASGAADALAHDALVRDLLGAPAEVAPGGVDDVQNPNGVVDDAISTAKSV